jgi:hypothetical protein
MVKGKNDATGAKRGAGPYSRSYPKLNRPPEYKPYATAGNTDHHQGKDISRAVNALSTRNFGLSAEVSRGNRPAHKAKDSSKGSGIDTNSPNPTKRDWR